MPVLYNFIIRILKILLPLGLVVLIVFLFINDLDADGERVLFHSPEQKSLLVEGPKPDNRVAGIKSESGEKFWVVTIDPVYFTITLPHRYDEIGVEIVFQAPAVSLVQLGGLASERGWNFYWQGLKNDVFDNIEWPCLIDADKNWYLCQRAKEYESIDEFLLNPPLRRRILNYNFALPENFSRLPVAGFNKETDYHDFDYLIGKYQPPELNGSWWKQEISFPIDSLYRQKNAVQFALSAPGLDKENKIVKIKYIKFILKKKPLTWKNFFPKLMDIIIKSLSD